MIKTNEKQSQMTKISNQKNRLRRFVANESKKSSLTIWCFERSSFSCFYRTQMTWKITIDYLSHVFTKKRNDVWIKQTNKQTNHYFDQYHYFDRARSARSSICQVRWQRQREQKHHLSTMWCVSKLDFMII